MRLLSAIVLGIALAPAAAGGAEYYIYKDAGGAVVLSNLPAVKRPADRAPQSLAMVGSYDFADASAEDIAATEKENREAERMSAMRDLAYQTERLADEMQRSNDIAMAVLRHQILRPPMEINQVIVHQGLRGSRFIGRR
jgi:hypothetical protein